MTVWCAISGHQGISSYSVGDEEDGEAVIVNQN